MGSLRGVCGAVVDVESGSRFLVAPGATRPGDAENNFDALILESVDETLGDLLGRRAREAVYDYLERSRFMARSEIPKNLDEFFSALEGTFGKGSRTIGRVAARRLYSKLGLKFFELPNANCRDYVELAKTKLNQ